MQGVAFGASLTVLDHLMLKWPPGIFTGLDYLVRVAVLLVVDGEGLAGLDPLGEGVSAQTGRVGFLDLTEISILLQETQRDLKTRHAGSLALKIRDEIFVKRVGGENLAARKPVVVKDSAHFD